MPYYNHQSVLGELYFDKNLQPVDKPRQKSAQILEPTEHKKKQILHALKDPSHFRTFVKANIEQSIKDLSTALTPDTLIIQSSGSCEDMQKILNMLHNRIREWVGYVSPELVHVVPDTSKLVKQLRDLSIPAALKKAQVQGLMTSSQPKEAEKGMNQVIHTAFTVEESLKKEREHLDKLCLTHVPNITEICGAVLGAKLLALAGSLERMARMPSSTIQMLGAEAALFRHLRSKARPPKHGILHEHPLISKVDKKDKGKAARDLANKISLAAKIDHFKGDFAGKKFKQDLQRRFGPW